MKSGSFIRLFILLLFLCASISAPAQAQDEVSFESLLIDIWPEYDQPAVLVIYHITLAPETTLPVKLAMRIPSAAGVPHAVAMQDQNGLYNLAYETNATRDWTEISFTTPVNEVRIEYYDPTISRSGIERSFVYRWAGDYTVENLTIQLQRPSSAANLRIKPDMGSGRIGEDGLTYYTYLAGKVKAGTTFELSFTYEKGNDDLTSPGQFQPVEPSQPIEINPAGRFDPILLLPWVIAATGLLLVAAGLVWYTRTGRTRAPVSRRRHRPADDEPNHGEAVYCHHCGKKAAPGDAFCRTCGTKLR